MSNRRSTPRRLACRQAIAAALAAGPLRRKQLLRVVRPAGHSVSLITKELADLTRGGELANPKDGSGYRLAGTLTVGADLFRFLAAACGVAVWEVPATAPELADDLTAFAALAGRIAARIG